MIANARWAGLSIFETANLLGFSQTTVSRVFTQTGEKNKQTKRKHPVSSSSMDRNASVMIEVTGERPDWCELTERLQ